MRIFSRTNHRIIYKHEFKRLFFMQKTLHTALGLRSRLLPVVGSSISEICKYTGRDSSICIDIKADMLRRCYGSKAPEHQVKRVRFNLQKNNAYSVSDHMSVKSERRSTKRLLETFYSNSPSKTPTSMQMNNSP